MVKNGDLASRPEPFLVANHMWGPSYVSLEAALSHWNMIPERTYEVSSMTIKSAKTYETAIGRFSYYRAPLPYYAYGIKSVQLTPKQVALIASPEKAICDKIITTAGILLRSQTQTLDYLLEDLRIDEDTLRKLDIDAIASWINDAPKKTSLSMLVRSIQQLRPRYKTSNS